MWIIIPVLLLVIGAGVACWILSRAQPSEPQVEAEPPPPPRIHWTRLEDGTTFCNECGAFADEETVGDIVRYLCPRCEIELLPPLDDDQLDGSTASGSSDLMAP